MGETHRQATATTSRLGMRGAGGEIVEVQGGHIVRSTGRKDRHSKVCTAKGPRDRRVRLSAHTAIQFYDVQDRLGYDRPSKAVDWLIKKAKAAIDELKELPAWNPTTMTTSSTHYHHQEQQSQQQNVKDESDNNPIGLRRGTVDAVASSSRKATTVLVGSGGRVSESNVHNRLGENPKGVPAFLPPSLDADIADTIKSFLPMAATSPPPPPPSSMIQFQNYPPDLLSRTNSSNQNQDLRLSLQSFQEPILLHDHHHQQPQAQTHHHHQNEHVVLFSGTTPLGFDGASAGWSEQHHSEENSRLHRMVAWNAGADTGNGGHGGAGGGAGGGFVFNSPSPLVSPALTPMQTLFGQSQYFSSQRGPLQSSNTPSIRAWIDPSSITTTATVNDHHHHPHHHYFSPTTIHQSSVSGIGFGSDGFSGFLIPARIQGEEEHDGVSDKPSSASSDSRH